MGRPTKYSQKLADSICQRIAEGETLVQICKSGSMPHRATVMKWLSQRDDFRDNYVRAHELQAEKEFEEIEGLAATATPETVQVVKLQVDTRKWCLARKAPKKYGDKVHQEVTGKDGGPVETVNKVERVIVRPEDSDG